MSKTLYGLTARDTETSEFDITWWNRIGAGVVVVVVVVELVDLVGAGTAVVDIT